MVELGSQCRDTITGFTGTATARYEFLNGCVRYQLEKAGGDTGVIELVFDEQRLNVIATPESEPVKSDKGGAPGLAPRTGVR